MDQIKFRSQNLDTLTLWKLYIKHNEYTQHQTTQVRLAFGESPLYVYQSEKTYPPAQMNAKRLLNNAVKISQKTKALK